MVIVLGEPDFTPAAGAGDVFVGSRSGVICALTAVTGSVAWKHAFLPACKYWSTPGLWAGP